MRDFTQIGGYVVPLPGANAALTALTASGITPQPFFFYGFLNRQKKEKKKELELLKTAGDDDIYEAPHRLKETLTAMHDVLGNRTIAVTRELTKKYEEFIRGTIAEVMEWANEDQIRGEFCLVVEGNQTLNRMKRKSLGGRSFLRKNMWSIT